MKISSESEERLDILRRAVDNAKEDTLREITYANHTGFSSSMLEHVEHIDNELKLLTLSLGD